MYKTINTFYCILINGRIFGAISGYALQYEVLAVAISFLAILSSVIKRKVHVGISIDSKSLSYLIVGVLLIVDGVTSIPSQISTISYLYQLASTVQGEKDILMNTMYWNIVPIAFNVLQIGIGSYFTLMTIKWDKQIEATH